MIKLALARWKIMVYIIAKCMQSLVEIGPLWVYVLTNLVPKDYLFHKQNIPQLMFSEVLLVLESCLSQKCYPDHISTSNIDGI